MTYSNLQLLFPWAVAAGLLHWLMALAEAGGL